MKYFSEVTNKVYPTVEALEAEEKKIAEEKRLAEEAELKKKANRETRAKEVEAAIEEAAKAYDIASTKLKAFVKDYGAFHTSLKGDHDFASPLRMLFNIFDF